MPYITNTTCHLKNRLYEFDCRVKKHIISQHIVLWKNALNSLGIDNKTEEIEASQGYTNIKMFRIESTTSSQPENDILLQREYWTEWVDPTTEGWKFGKFLMDFSAICFLFAREMSEHLGNKPLGLIASSYAGLVSIY